MRYDTDVSIIVIQLSIISIYLPYLTSVFGKLMKSSCFKRKREKLRNSFLNGHHATSMSRFCISIKIQLS